MTYDVFGGTLNRTQSINHQLVSLPTPQTRYFSHTHAVPAAFSDPQLWFYVQEFWLHGG